MPAAQVESLQDRRKPRSREALVLRVSGEFFEMPCLRLTAAQARRLFGLRQDICDRVFAALIADGTLTRDSEGRYQLTQAGAESAAHAAGLRGPTRAAS